MGFGNDHDAPGRDGKPASSIRVRVVAEDRMRR